MQKLHILVVLGGAFLFGCNSSPKGLCEHIGKISAAPANTAVLERCIGEMKVTKKTNAKLYDCLAPCVDKAKTESDVDDCRFTCGGSEETPMTVCKRLLNLRGMSSGVQLSACMARYQAMQTASATQFACAAACARKAVARANAETCLSGCSP